MPFSVRTMLARTAEQAGIDKRVHPHGLRHTMAYVPMMEGCRCRSSNAGWATYRRRPQTGTCGISPPADVVETMQQREWHVPSSE